MISTFSVEKTKGKKLSTILYQQENKLSFLEKEFKKRLSSKPYCADDLEYGLQIRNKKNALSKRYIQANTPFNLSWLCFDIDYPCVLETTFKEKILPLPNLMVVNPENNHSHLLYGIKDSIYLTDNAHINPIKYAQAVSYSLREELNADIGYTGLIIKNPLNKIWDTIELSENLWSLNELAEYLVLPKKLPKKESLIGLGRNCTLFELGRKYAYAQVLKYKILKNRDDFYQEVLIFIETHNKNFPVPLSFADYSSIAKSISNWTWRHYGDKTTKQWAIYVKKTHGSEAQAFRGKLGGQANSKERQAIKGSIGGKNNSSEQQSIKGKIGAIKSAEIRFKGSNEDLKPWLTLGISRRTYYRRMEKK